MKKRGYYILQLNAESLPVQDGFVQLITDPKTREPIDTWERAIQVGADIAQELRFKIYQIVEIKMTVSIDWVPDKPLS